MAKPRVFISFDYDHDEDIKTMLVGQTKLVDSPFDFADASVKEHLTGDWKEKVKRRMQNCDQIIVLCGQYTHLATGVSEEVKIAQGLGKPYFLLIGRSDKACYKPSSAYAVDIAYTWSWPNLKALISGAR